MTVNAEGERFMDKKFYGDTLALLVEQTNSCGYGIYDASNEIVDRLEAGVEAGVVAKYDNLDDLASGQGIGADALKSRPKAPTSSRHRSTASSASPSSSGRFLVLKSMSIAVW